MRRGSAPARRPRRRRETSGHRCRSRPTACPRPRPPRQRRRRTLRMFLSRRGPTRAPPASRLRGARAIFSRRPVLTERCACAGRRRARTLGGLVALVLLPRSLGGLSAAHAVLVRAHEPQRQLRLGHPALLARAQRRRRQAARLALVLRRGRGHGRVAAAGRCARRRGLGPGAQPRLRRGVRGRCGRAGRGRAGVRPCALAAGRVAVAVVLVRAFGRPPAERGQRRTRGRGRRAAAAPAAPAAPAPAPAAPGRRRRRAEVRRALRRRALAPALARLARRRDAHHKRRPCGRGRGQRWRRGGGRPLRRLLRRPLRRSGLRGGRGGSGQGLGRRRRRSRVRLGRARLGRGRRLRGAADPCAT